NPGPELEVVSHPTHKVHYAVRAFSFPRATATGRGANRYQAESSSSVGWKRIASGARSRCIRSSTAERKLSYRRVRGTEPKALKARTWPSRKALIAAPR